MFGPRKVALAIAALLITAPAAQSQDFSNIVTFGDSLSDDAIGPVTNGLFSNGPVWVQQLGNTGIAPDANVALGGARADADPNANGPIPGVMAQFGLVPPGTITPDSLVTVWAGANDIFQNFTAQLPTILMLPPDQQATATIAIGVETATDQVGNVQVLAATNPGTTILVPNLPSLGATPGAAAQGPAAQAGLGAATLGYNSALSTGLNQLAGAPGITANIIQMDVASAFEAVLANPAAFGFDNVTAPCTNSLANASGAACAAGQDNFLFWDAIHPTTAGHALLAQLATSLLTFEEDAAESAALSEVGLNLRHQGVNDIFDRTDSWITGTYSRQNGLWAEIKGFQGTEDKTGANRIGYDYGFYGVRAGVDLEFSDNLVGASFAVMKGQVETANIDSDLLNFQFDIYGSKFFGPLFITAQAGAAGTNGQEQTRATGLGPITAESSTDGYQFDVAGEVGALLTFGNFSIIPAARMTYITARTIGYTEESDVLALDIGDHEVSALFGAVRLRGVANIGAISSFLEVGYEDHLSYDNDAFQAALFNNTANPETISLGDQSVAGLYFKAGVDGKVNDNIALNFQYGYETRNGDGETHSGKLRVKFTR